MTQHTCIRIAAICGFLAVMFGSMGAHGSIHDRVKEYGYLESWESAVFYHFVHTLVILILATRAPISTGIVITFLLGIVLFSGSLYIRGFTNIAGWGKVTPIGGIAFLVGWAWLFFSTFGKSTS